MKVILYIGHHKVGSTALQAYLAQNWLNLAKEGILYPSVEGHGFAANLAQGLGRPPLKDASVHIREPHSALAYRMIADVCDRKIPKQFSGLPATPQMLRSLRMQVETLQPHTVILCSEAFANFGQVAADQIDRLCATFEGAEFHVYCALRRPDEYIASWHGQRLKVGEMAKPLPEGGMEQYYNGIHFNYRTVVEAWAERVPEATLSIRNYSDILSAGGSAEDFIASTGVRLPAEMVAPGRANTSLPFAAYSLMEHAISHLKAPLVSQLSQYIMTNTDSLTLVSKNQVELFGVSQRQKMLEDFQPVEDYLARLTDQTSFFPDLAEVAVVKPVTAEDATRKLLDALDPDDLPSPDLREHIRKLKSEF